MKYQYFSTEIDATASLQSHIFEIWGQLHWIKNISELVAPVWQRRGNEMTAHRRTIVASSILRCSLVRGKGTLCGH